MSRETKTTTQLVLYRNLDGGKCIERLSNDLADVLYKNHLGAPATRDEEERTPEFMDVVTFPGVGGRYHVREVNGHLVRLAEGRTDHGFWSPADEVQVVYRP